MSAVTIVGWHLHEMLSTVAFAALDECTKGLPCCLHGIHLRASGARLHLAATDNHRIAYSSRPASVPSIGMPWVGLDSGEVSRFYEACATGAPVVLRMLDDALIVEGGVGGAARFKRMPPERAAEFPTNYATRMPASWVATVRIEAAPLLRTLHTLMLPPTAHSTLRLRRNDGQLVLASATEILARVPHLVARWDTDTLAERGICTMYLAAAEENRELRERLSGKTFSDTAEHWARTAELRAAQISGSGEPASAVNELQSLAAQIRGER
jgi:hypothetical protein